MARVLRLAWACMDVDHRQLQAATKEWHRHMAIHPHPKTPRRGDGEAPLPVPGAAVSGTQLPAGTAEAAPPEETSSQAAGTADPGDSAAAGDTRPSGAAVADATAPDATWGDGQAVRQVEAGGAPPPVTHAATSSVTLGRAADNSIVLDHPMISRHHARLARTASGEHIVTDLGSSAGTFVNGRRITRARLMPGAEVRIGPYRFVFTGHELLQYDESRGIRVDALHLTQAVRGGLFRQEKVILDDVSLTILPGAFVAVVGSSGAGKSTLLNALSGQRPAEQGMVLYNGVNFYENMEAFSGSIAYVPQDDIIHKNLPVERALLYSARMRLPRDLSRKQIKERVRQVLEDVDLYPQRGQLVSALSGGQRKRVNIAVELLSNPSIFYLDEPTSGLDPGLDRTMMEMLRRLADRGHTIVLSTHATSNIDVCDFVCFMAPGGKLAFYGTPDELKREFGTSDYADIYNELHDNPAKWIALFRESPEYLEYVASPQAQSESRPRRENPPHPAYQRRDYSLRHFFVLAQRYIELLMRDRANLAILLLQAPIIGFLVAMLTPNQAIHDAAARVGDPVNSHIYAQQTLLIMVSSAIWFGIINAAREIVKEAPIYRREHAINLGAIPYVLSKVLVLGVLSALQSFILLYVVSIKSGLPRTGIIIQGDHGGFIELYITLLLAAFSGMMLGLLVSAVAPNTDRAMSLVPILLVPQIIFANVIFTLSGATNIVSFFVPARWAQQAAGSTARLINRFTDHADQPFYSTDPKRLWGFWAALVGLTVMFFLAALVMQRRKGAIT